jgi:hypothetical protein
MHKQAAMIAALCAFRLLDVFLFINLSLAFFDRDDPVRRDVRYFIDCAAGPTHFDQFHLRSLLETEVQPQIAL